MYHRADEKSLSSLESKLVGVILSPSTIEKSGMIVFLVNHFGNVETVGWYNSATFYSLLFGNHKK